MVGSLHKVLLSIASAVVLSTASALPAMSLSPEDTQKKLEVIAVFVLVNDKGEFYQVTQGDTSVIPLYLQAAAARGQLDRLLKSQKGLKGRIQAFSLNLLYKQADDLRQNLESSGKKLSTPIVISEANMNRASQILKSEGLDEKKIQEGLRTPIFFSEPMITVKTSYGDRQVFFVDYYQLQQAIEKLPADQRGRVKERVADLEVILELIRESKDDQYAFMPTEDYQKIREEYVKNQPQPKGKK